EPPVEKKEPAADVADLDAVVEAAIKDAAAAGVSEKPPVAAPPAKEPEELEEVIEEPPPPPAEVEEVAAAPPVEEVAPPVEEVAPPVEEVAPPVEEPPPPEEEKEEAVVDDVVAELLEAAEAPPVEKVAVEPPPPAEAPPAEVAVPVDDIVAELLEEAQKPPAEAPPPPPERVPAEVPPERAPAEIPPAVPPMEAAVPPAGALPPPVAVQPKKVQIPRDSREAAIFFAKGEEALLRKAYEQHAEQTLVEAQKALETRKLVDAMRLFKEAIEAFKRVGDRPEKRHLLELAKKGHVESTYQRAVFLTKHGDLKPAEQLARRASVEGHPMAPILLADIEALKKAPPLVPQRQRVRWKEKEYKEYRRDIMKLLLRGREYFASGELDRANASIEAVLKLDPFNTEAIRMRRKIMQRKLDLASMELEATRKGMMADVRRTWNPRDYANIHDTMKTKALEERQPRAHDDEIRMLEVVKKMKSIKIPELSFIQANIQDVIAFLQDASVEYDPEPDPAKKQGVNIILHLGAGQRPGVGQDAADAGLEEGFGVDEPAAAPALEVPLITFTARFISLFEALKIVTQVANLKSRIQGNVVIIVPKDAPDGDIIVRMYDVKPTFMERIPAMSGVPGLAGGPGDAFGGGEDLVPGGLGVRDDPKGFFESMGVKWPTGSSIRHIAAIGKLVVANTPNNLATFEKILAVLDVVPSQIEIEARFVEVRQTDLDSLGFEWLLTDDWEIAQEKGASGPHVSRPRIQMDENAGAGGFTKINRYFPQLSGGEAVADDFLSIASVLTNPELKLVLHMLQRQGNTDLLSAPKVTTKSGSEAVIKVVTEYIYPTEFTVTGIAGGADAGGGAGALVGAVVEPSGFEMREVGVILEVAPDVSPEGQMIDLTMTPQVVSEPVWKNYGSTYTDGEGNVQQLNMEQPFFHARTVSTSISIYNGATVVMGGMITEKRTDVDDKIPFIGDIPLIGRIFRSRYEKSEKNNLLIFVTARLVDPAGRTIKRATDTRSIRDALLGNMAGAGARGSGASPDMMGELAP
ncbi:hypothetical protein ACFLQU_03640, partial [Verrucomicrobiota bacterium]